MDAATTDSALRALAHPGRRQALRLLRQEERTSGQIAEACGWARPAASQHLGVLKGAGLVEVQASGNQRVYRARPAALAELRRFLDDFWDDRLDTLAEHVRRR